MNLGILALRQWEGCFQCSVALGLGRLGVARRHLPLQFQSLLVVLAEVGSGLWHLALPVRDSVWSLTSHGSAARLQHVLQLGGVALDSRGDRLDDVRRGEVNFLDRNFFRLCRILLFTSWCRGAF